jgi:hypothetical protein
MVSHALGLAIIMPGPICVPGAGIVMSPPDVVVFNVTGAALVCQVGTAMEVGTVVGGAPGPVANTAALMPITGRPG